MFSFNATPNLLRQMKLNECSTVYICPAHNPKYIARKQHMDTLLKHLQFSKFEHFKSGTDRQPKCLNDAYTTIFSQHLNDEPLILLEDDVEVFNSNLNIDVPPDADAIQIGISKCGGHPTENKDLGHSTWSPQNTELVRIQNMLSTHAIVYLSKRYKQAVMNVLSKSGSEHSDVHISRIQKQQNVQAMMKPIFQQSDKFGNHPLVKRMTQFMIHDDQVSVVFQGGLGKQLFQAMAGASQAITNGLELVGHNIKNDNVFSVVDGSSFSKVSWKPYDDKVAFVHKEIPVVKNIQLRGTFQHSKQFLRHLKECLAYLKIEVLETSRKGSAVHYLVDTPKKDDFQCPLSLEQFRKQLENSPKPWFLYSNVDARDFAKKLDCEFVSEDSVKDFWALVSFDHLIIDNSTQAFWAAQLCRFRNPKAVIKMPSPLQTLFG